MKECPKSVIEAGGAYVLLRHHLEKGDRLFEQLFEKLEATKPDLKAAGMMQAAYGASLAKLHQARMAYGLVCESHLLMAQHVKGCEMDTPTDEQLVGIVGTLNWR